jgi:hypothetical protein
MTPFRLLTPSGSYENIRSQLEGVDMGRNPFERQPGSRGQEMTTRKCEKCGGTGKVQGATCKSCLGTGKRRDA